MIDKKWWEDEAGDSFSFQSYIDRVDDRLVERSISKITNRLYLGGAPSDVSKLYKLGIKNVLSVAKECHDEVRGYDGGINLEYVGMRDHSPLSPWMAKQAILTLREMLKRGKTLVHCGIGVSRSPTIIALYWYAMGEVDSVAQGVRKLKEIRSCVSPNRIVDDNLMQMVESLRKNWARPRRSRKGSSTPTTELATT